MNELCAIELEHPDPETARIHPAQGHQTPAEFEAAVVASGVHPVQLSGFTSPD